MPSVVNQARKRITDAQKQLETLEAERTTLAEELTGAEAAERAVIQKRGGLSAIQDAQGKTAAIRAVQTQTEAEIAQLIEQLPVWEDELERETRLHEMQKAAGIATEAEAQLREIVGGIAQNVRGDLERALAAFITWDQARATYNGAGREVIAGYRNMEPLWDQPSPERRELEDLLRRRGHGLKAVTQDLTAPDGDLYLRGAWGLLRSMVSEHRRVKLAEEEEARRAEAKRRNKLQEERERRALTATLTVPKARADEAVDALASLQIRSTVEIQQKLSGPTGDNAEFVRIGISQPDKETARGLLYSALGEDWAVENVLFTDDERAYYLRE